MRFTLAAVLALASAALAQSSSSAAGASATGKSVSKSESASATITDSAAQASASALGLTPCVLNCLAAAANVTECKLPTNVTCACTDADFQQKSTSCIQQECKADELKAAVAAQQQQCGALSLSPSASPSATAPFTPSNPAADISGSPSATGSGSSPSSSAGAGGSGNTGGASVLGSNIVYAALVAVAAAFVV